ncbi:MAG: hypothetical protein ACQESF_06685, partial [Nanobdellota archaeon]
LLFFSATDNDFYPLGPKGESEKYFGKRVHSAVTWIDVNADERKFLSGYSAFNPDHPKIGQYEKD